MPYTIGSIISGVVSYVGGGTFAGGVAAAGQTAFTVAGTSVTVGQVVGTVALTAASLAFAPGVPSPASQKITVRNPTAARRRIYGRFRVGSVLVELKVQEPAGDGILYVGSMIASGEIDEIEEHRFNDQITRIRESDGQVLYPAVWLDVNRVQLQYHLGADSQVTDTLLSAAFPARWTSAHQLNGIAYTVGKFNGVPLEDFATVYQAGVPSYSALVRGAKVYDPRESGHDWDDPSTWEWTQNAALIVMDFLWHEDGMRLPRSLISSALDDWIAAADTCDEVVPLIGATETGDGEPRYRLSGVYELTEKPIDVLKKMLACFDGRVYLKEDSSISIQVGEFIDPGDDATFTDDDIIAYSNFRRGAAKTELKNEVRAIYTSPGHDYLSQEADPWRDEESITLDGTQTVTLPLEWCPSHSQARRVMKINANRLNPEWMGTVITNARGLGALNKRFIHLTLTDLGIDMPFFVLRSDINLLSGTCTFEVVSCPEETYDWDATEEGNSPEFETPGDWGVVVPEGATEVTITADGAGGGGENGANGGGGGARSVKTVAIDPADWGDVIQFTVGRAGVTDTLGAQSSTDGGDSTVTANLVAGSISMIAGGGFSGFNGGGGGSASGGDTNTAGGNHSGGNGGTAASGAEDNGSNKSDSPGGGGHEWGDGGEGRVTFDWTYA
jgi:hypothetical protein